MSLRSLMSWSARPCWHNTDLRMAQANLERSVALLRQARAARQPTAEVNFDPSYQQLSSESYLHSGTVPPTGLYDAGVSVRYELDVFGRLKRAIEAAAADDEAVRAAYDLTKITVAAETARAYADACNAGEELQVTRRSLQLQAQSTDTTRRLVEAGRTSSVDLTRSSAQVAQVRANIPALEAQRMNALYTPGRPDRQANRLNIRDRWSRVRLRRACSSRSRSAMRQRCCGGGRTCAKRSASWRRRLRVSAWPRRICIPRIAVGASAGSTGATSDFLRTPTNRFGIGLAIHWEANQSLARARIAQANAAAKFALAQFDAVVLTALRDAESALSTYSRNRETR